MELQFFKILKYVKPQTFGQIKFQNSLFRNFKNLKYVRNINEIENLRGGEPIFQTISSLKWWVPFKSWKIAQLSLSPVLSSSDGKKKQHKYKYILICSNEAKAMRRINKITSCVPSWEILSLGVYKNAMRVSVLHTQKKRKKHTVCIQMDFIFFFAFPSHSFHYNLRYVNKICECQTNEVNDKNFQAVVVLLCSSLFSRMATM